MPVNGFGVTGSKDYEPDIRASSGLGSHEALLIGITLTAVVLLTLLLAGIMCYMSHTAAALARLSQQQDALESKPVLPRYQM